MGRLTVRRTVTRVQRDGARHGKHSRPDTIVVEEPLEIRVGGAPLAVTMRTPGNDMDLAAGFLLTEGVITKADDLRTMRFCGGAGTGRERGQLLQRAGRRPRRPRGAAATLGGARVLHDLVLRDLRQGEHRRDPDQRTAYPVQSDPVTLHPALLAELPERLRAAQQVFDRTGGLHAAGIFDAEGALLVLREDVGRHNAVDKVIGWAVRENRIPLSGSVLLVSGRASFELTQKAVMAGIPALAAVSAPSSLAVELAEESGITLIGFLRGDTMNVYAGGHRIPD